VRGSHQSPDGRAGGGVRRCWRDAECRVFQSFYPVRADRLPALNQLGQETRAACQEHEGNHPDLATSAACVNFRCQMQGVMFSP
jgi:hypothetical protein